MLNYMWVRLIDLAYDQIRNVGMERRGGLGKPENGKAQTVKRSSSTLI